MITRTQSYCSKSIQTIPLDPVVIAAGTTVTVLLDVRTTPGEYASRLIQNVGNNSCNFAFGREASAVDYNGVLASGNQADCTLEKVSVYSAAGTTIALTVLMNRDLQQGGGGIIPQA